MLQVIDITLQSIKAIRKNFPDGLFGDIYLSGHPFLTRKI